MKEYILQREQFIVRPLEEVWAFFSEVGNLDAITPPWLNFRLITPRPIEMADDAIIDYIIKWRGFPLNWRTRILIWRPMRLFVDVQEQGPYRLWHHTHTFEARDGGTLMGDRVRYAPPLGPVGHWVQKILIGRDVEAIFDYRYQEIERLFGGAGSDPGSAEGG